MWFKKEKQGDNSHKSKDSGHLQGEQRSIQGLLVPFFVCRLCMLYHNLKQSEKKKKMNSTGTVEVEVIRTCV